MVEWELVGKTVEKAKIHHRLVAGFFFHSSFGKRLSFHCIPGLSEAVRKRIIISASGRY